jgi:hypothetical protein
MSALRFEGPRYKLGVTLSPKKCHMGYQTLSFLSHTISNLGIGTADGTVEAVRKFPEPLNVKELQRFLGVCAYYLRFEKGFSILASPLQDLLKQDVKWKWSQECQKRFDELKIRPTTSPVLAHPNYDEPFSLQTDAFMQGVGGILKQLDDEGREYPVAFISRLLDPAEENYTITELECLAIIWLSASYTATWMAQSSLWRPITRHPNGSSTSRGATEGSSDGRSSSNRIESS